MEGRMHMTELGGIVPPIEAEVVIMLAPRNGPVPRETLEDTTLHVEDVLTTHGAEIAPGASASTNLDAGTIEIDAVIEAMSPAELHQKIGGLIEVLFLHSALIICNDDGEELVMRSSATQVALPLVPA
jgi:hypothetical protein